MDVLGALIHNVSSLNSLEPLCDTNLKVSVFEKIVEMFYGQIMKVKMQVN